MGLAEWFKKTTLQGRIRRDLGSVKLDGGLLRTRLEIQELEPKAAERRFRLNVVSTSALSWQSLPLVLNEQQLTELSRLVLAALDTSSSEALHPTGW